MRILAIRGCNLASLAGEFEIDLAGGPIGGAGVFAIVGPTGAGKSTLLDAMCVALFDRTPRLANRSTVVIGRGEDDATALGAQDVRGLLRRGASAGYAEVDFESGDLRRYRARWSVRRARGASDGNMQDAQVTLTTIDGIERFGGTKTETLKAIHQRLGLTFDQFRRSALLAQGEFAAFLRADGKDRSELLERMTGTEIYSKLSIAAHQRATLAEQQLREGRNAALAIAVLTDEARAIAETELVGAREAVGIARTRLASADAAAKWLAEAALRDRALADAKVTKLAADQAVEAAAPERAELALRRRAETLRPTWDEAARLDRQLAIVRGEVVTATAEVERAVLAQQAIVARRARLVELHAPLREARIAAGLVERKRTHREADVEARATAAAPDAAWLLARKGLAVEIGGWRDLDAKFVHHATLTGEISAADRALAEHAQKRIALDKKRALAVGDVQAAAGKLEEAKRETASFQQKRGLTLDAARREEDAARLRCSDVDRLAVIAAEARSASTARTEFDRQLADLLTASASDNELKTSSLRERDTATVLRTERGRLVAELRRAAGYEHARAELVEGEPCPLCGAAEHPWRDRGTFDALIGEAEAQLEQAVHQYDRAVAALAAIAAREHQRGVERARLVACRATAETTASSTVVKWRGQLAALGELVFVDEPASPAAQQLAEERAATARAKLEAARLARSQAEAVAKASQEAQARVQARQTEVELAAGKLKDLDGAIAQLETTLERLRGERAGKAARHAELATEIDAAIARWAAALPEHGKLTQHAMAEVVAAWHVRIEAVCELDAALVAALAQIDHTSRDVERTVAEHTARRADAERRREVLAGELREAAARLAAARATVGFEADELQRLLDGEPGRVQLLIEQLAALELAAESTRTLLAERQRLADDHEALRPAMLDDAPLVIELTDAVASAEQHAATLAAMLAADLDARNRRAAALAGLAAAEQAAEIDRVLGQVIGSHDGKLFRSFAQSLTLDGLLDVANSHLEELAPRYQLERVPKHDLELQVIDRDLGGEVRSVQSLSGGESFLVSLALALGLSSMSAHDVRVRTLLIDEGFGTLDPATLDSALAVLDALQATGRQVGVISHVPALVERVGAHIRVSPRGGGRSEVIVVD